jgi:hypothetical protein
VNKILARMKVAEAEEVVEQMQEGGMLSFRWVGVCDSVPQEEDQKLTCSERGVRDMTQ